MRKSQYSMEFLIFFVLLTIIFIVWLVIYLDLHEEVFFQRDKKAVMDLGKAVQTHIFVAANAHTGYYSRSLIIPEKAGRVDFDIKMQNLTNGSYVFYFQTKHEDYTFNIPYSLGELKKGQNILWDVNGVVGINLRPILNADGSVRMPQCKNFADDDGDGLMDWEEDGGCWYDALDPKQDINKDDEMPNTIDAPAPGEVYNFYPWCQHAEEEGFCGMIDSFKVGIKKQDCIDYALGACSQ